MHPNRISWALLPNIPEIKTVGVLRVREICRNIQLFPSWLRLPPMNVNVAGMRTSALNTRVGGLKPKVMSQRSTELISSGSLTKIID